MENFKEIKMNLSNETLLTIDELSRILNTNNRTKCIGYSVRVLHHLLTEVNKGKKIYLESRNYKEELKLNY